MGLHGAAHKFHSASNSIARTTTSGEVDAGHKLLASVQHNVVQPFESAKLFYALLLLLLLLSSTPPTTSSLLAFISVSYK